MQIYILAVGEKPPAWVDAGVQQYLARMPHECNVKIISVGSGKRSKNSNIKQAQQQEEMLLLKKTPKNSYRIALDEHGLSWSTEKLANKLDSWLQSSPIVTMYIGGPDGFSEEFLQQADSNWSLSALTLPHMLVRVLLAEQLYRAWSMLQGHPYHRA